MSAKAATMPKGAVRFMIAVAIFVIIAAINEVHSRTGLLFDPLFRNNNLEVTSKDVPSGKKYKVTKVFDGDTIEIEYGNTLERVRMIGINTPELSDTNTRNLCLAEEAKDRLKNLVEGKDIVLMFDESQDIRDTYNRLLAYVYLPSDGQLVNRKMIAEGLAYEYTFINPYKYQTSFKEAEIIAQRGGMGLWGNLCR